MAAAAGGGAGGEGEAPAEAELSEEQMMANIEASRAELAADGGDAGAASGVAAAAAVRGGAAAAVAAPFPEGHVYWSRLSTLRSILIGGLSVKLYLQFLNFTS